MSLVLGDIDKAALNGIADKLANVISGLGPAEAAVVTTAIDHLQTMGVALESKTMADLFADVKAVEDPILARLDKIIAIGEKFQTFAGGFDISVTPKPPQ